MCRGEVEEACRDIVCAEEAMQISLCGESIVEKYG